MGLWAWRYGQPWSEPIHSHQANEGAVVWRYGPLRGLIAGAGRGVLRLHLVEGLDEDTLNAVVEPLPMFEPVLDACPAPAGGHAEDESGQQEGRHFLTQENSTRAGEPMAIRNSVGDPCIWTMAGSLGCTWKG